MKTAPTTIFYTMAVQVDGRLRDVIEVASKTPNKDIEAAARACGKVVKFLEGRHVLKVVIVHKVLVNIITQSRETGTVCDKCGAVRDGKVTLRHWYTSPHLASKIHHEMDFCSIQCLIKEVQDRNEYDEMWDFRRAMKLTDTHPA